MSRNQRAKRAGEKGEGKRECFKQNDAVHNDCMMG